jgi:hypothetical protein
VIGVSTYPAGRRLGLMHVRSCQKRGKSATYMLVQVKHLRSCLALSSVLQCDPGCVHIAANSNIGAPMSEALVVQSRVVDGEDCLAGVGCAIQLR